MRYALAVLAANTTAKLIRLLKKGGGTSYPGLVAKKIDPNLLSKLNGQLTRGSVLITGTNGKTTTTALVQRICQEAGLEVVHNKTGANLVAGITVSFLQAANWRGKLNKEVAIIETDEGVFPQLCQALQPKMVVVTNFFRDQLDRFGELDKTVAYIRDGLSKLPKGATVLLNADDPRVVGLSEVEGLNYVYFGVQDVNLAHQEMDQTTEGKYCPRCGTLLEYDHYYYSHMGVFYCPQCQFSRPNPRFKATKIQLNGLAGSRFEIEEEQAGIAEITSFLPGLYNVYNILSAYATGKLLGIENRICQKAIASFHSVFGRMERLTIEGKSVMMVLVKNPAGWNEVMRTLFQHQGQYHLFLGLNDQIPDGTDVSWIWDADAEQLLRFADRISGLTISGSRAFDMAVRLKYAGVDVDVEQVEPNLAKAWEKSIAETKPDQTLVIIPNYTVMLTLQELMAQKGYVKPYWEENHEA